MSSQPSLITVSADAKVKRPGGSGIQRQFFRRPGAQGSGVYCAMDENGNVEIIGGPGVSGVVQFGSGGFSVPAGSTPLTVITIPTPKMLRMIWVNIKETDSGRDAGSNGVSNEIEGSCTYFNLVNETNSSVQGFVGKINSNNISDGWFCRIQNVTPTSFAFQFTKDGDGANIDVRYHLIMQ